MNSKNKIIAILILCIFSFWFCQKKLFKKIEIHGKLINYFSNEPVEAEVTLKAFDATTDKSSVPHITLDKTNSNSAGEFTFKGKAAKSGKYYLYIDKKEESIGVNEGGITYLKDIPCGDYTFNCHVTLVSISGSAIDFYENTGTSEAYHFNAGTNTQFNHALTYSKTDYENSGHKYFLNYKTYPWGTTTYSQVAIPITSSSNYSVTINY